MSAVAKATAPSNVISLRGVRVHNLKNIDLEIPRGELVAVCGVSGSGKTSLALDTLYAEGQRRYIESFSAYTRQYLERLQKPDFDTIEGLPPALAVTRGGSNRGNRSTVGTASETLDYLRLLFANAATPFCPNCSNELRSHEPQSVATVVGQLPKTQKIMVGFEASWDDVGHRAAVLAELQQSGFLRLISAGQLLNLGADTRKELAASLPGQGAVFVVVDRLKGGDSSGRATESIESCFDHGDGKILFLSHGDPNADTNLKASDLLGTQPRKYSLDADSWSIFELHQDLVCGNCKTELPAPEPRLFSFNSPLGACSQCEGFGDTIDLDDKLVIPDRSKSLAEGAIAPWTTPAYEHNLDELLDIAEELLLPTDVPYSKLTKRQQRLVWEGSDDGLFEGIQGFFRWLDTKKYKMHVRVFISRWRSYNRCSLCSGQRLNPAALAFKVGGLNIADACELQIDELANFLDHLELTSRQQEVVTEPLSQIRNRLGYLQIVGLGYLQLDRTIRTLSGGEAQRTALTAALGSTLVNMLYVLDEPSVGLHPHDVAHLADAIEGLKSRGNTVVIVEHEEALLHKADSLIEVGPAAGVHGGEIVAQGSMEHLADLGTLTGDYLGGLREVPIPAHRRLPRKHIKISNCSGNNLKNISVSIPLELLCVVTGVSGSGKSSLIQDTLHGAILGKLNQKQKDTLPFKSIAGTNQIQDCVLVDQSPVSRSPRSNPVTYIKAFEDIRQAFANTLDAKTRNLTPGHFSFNSDLGRCDQCKGDGVLQVDMQFLADVHMECPTCHGTRFRSDILKVKYRDRSIAEALSLTVNEAMDFFRGENKLRSKLRVLQDVGLDYLQLGQAATTLSSGEAQRLKLAGILSAATKKKTLFILDEPTTGLHYHDITKLLGCFDALLSAGHSLVIVEHNVHLMAAADHIIDLGPGAADDGGSIVAEGPPEEVAIAENSRTGQFLREHLGIS